MRQGVTGQLTALLAGTLVAGCCAWAADVPPTRATDLLAEKYSEWTTEQEIFVPMRDGVRLSTDVLLPKGASQKLPTVLVRTPYHRETQEITVAFQWHELWVKQGFAVVVQNERGKYFSEGKYKNYLQGASTDGYDTIDWIVKQPWSNGKVGTFGCSSSGETQWPLAAGNHPGHAAMMPGAPGAAVGDVPGNDTRGTMYRGGVPTIGYTAQWFYNHNPTERLLLPADSTQAQRIRLRNSYSLLPTLPPEARFYNQATWELDASKFEHLPSQDILRDKGGALTPFDNYIKWTPRDPRWKEVEFIGAGAKPRVPALHLDTWHDQTVVENTRLFKYLQDLGTENQYLIIGGGSHCLFMLESLTGSKNKVVDAEWKKPGAVLNTSNLKFGDVTIGDIRYGGDDFGYTKLFLNWFNYWLGGQQNQVTEMPKVQLYVMNQGWISGDRWPLKQTRFTKYYLNGDRTPELRAGMLSTTPPSRSEQDRYVYDPGFPTPSHGVGDEVGVALDQRPIEIRKDVLVYATAPLEKPVTIAGPVEVVLYVSSTAKDTDFFVKLVDIYPDGKAINLRDDAFRVRYREGFDKKVLMQPGQVYKITLPNMVTAIQFHKGHRIALQVSSSDFPFSERNLNTGGNNYDETTWVVAENSIHHGPQQPSHIVLPVLPDER